MDTKEISATIITQKFIPDIKRLHWQQVKQNQKYPSLSEFLKTVTTQLNLYVKQKIKSLFNR